VSDATVVSHDATTGKETGRRKIAEKRTISHAVLDRRGGFAVVGVADG
jgi:hypothetical protein